MDLVVSEGILDVDYEVTFAMTSFETGLSHGIVRFSAHLNPESASENLIETLKAKLAASSEQNNRKRTGNDLRSFPLHPNKQGRPGNVTGPAEMFDSGNHISGFQRIGSNEKVFTCDLCGAQSKSKAYLTRHVAVIHKKSTESMACEMCPFTTKWLQSLRKHYRRVHKIPQKIMNNGVETSAAPNWSFDQTMNFSEANFSIPEMEVLNTNTFRIKRDPGHY